MYLWNINIISVIICAWSVVTSCTALCCVDVCADAVVMFQGIYVLQDNKFRLLGQLSAGKQYLEQAPKVPCHDFIRLFDSELMCSVRLSFLSNIIPFYEAADPRPPNPTLSALSICCQITLYFLLYIL